MVQAYNNWYDNLSAGSLSYLQDIYLQWLNIPSSFCIGCTSIPNFSGIPQSKLIMGIPASSTAGNSAPSSATISQFINWTIAQNYSLKGWMIWDSHWDSINSFNISNSIIYG